ncbi:hypothetical protein P43SY_001185 [Pythium insidiosum]|uniref:Multidrug/Oligosaccharidyl-lipid/Polysaccharide (MOP) Flippase Superfamily n=1 Tax=Pythium insidiosum TaxID=114742 RepID=A0AAD5LGY7_PYTIN|nr:hypothetical protein P43SY_001185 [Pythium insidiosum]
MTASIELLTLPSPRHERSPLLPLHGEPKGASMDHDAAHEQQVSTRAELRELLALAYPVILTTALEFLPGFSSIVLTGHLESPLKKEYVAAATLSTMFTNITAFTIGSGLTSALDTIASQAFGANRLDRIGVYCQTAMLVVGVCLVPALALNFYTGAVLSWFGQDAVVCDLAQVFARYTLPGLPFIFLYDIERRVLQAQNIMTPLVVVAVVGNIVEIVVGYWLAYHTTVGFAGIAMARALGYAVLPIGMQLYFHLQPELLASWWTGWDLAAALDHVGLFVKLGVPGMLMMLMEWWAFEVLSLLAGVLPNGVLAVSAHTVQLNVVQLAYVVFLGLSVATNIRVGNCLGAGNAAGARMAARLGLAIVAVIGVCWSAGVLVFRNRISALFVDDAQTVEAASLVLVLWAPFEVLEALNCVMQGVFRGAGLQDLAARTNAFAYFVVGIPVAYALAFPGHWGLQGLWVGFGLGVSASFLALLAFFRSWNWYQLTSEADTRTAE